MCSVSRALQTEINREVTHKSLHITSVLFKIWLRFDPPQVSTQVFVDIVPFKESQFTRQPYLKLIQAAISVKQAYLQSA